MDVSDPSETSSSESSRSYQLHYDMFPQKYYCIDTTKYDEKTLEKLVYSDLSEDKEKLKSIIIKSVESNYVEAIEFFISKSCNIYDISIKDGRTLLHIAYYHDAHFVLKNLTALLPIHQITHIDCHGLTCLHIACWANDKELIKKCLENSVDVNAPIICDPEGHRNGYTALHFASTSSSEIVELLLKNGADANATDCSGRTPLHLACPCFGFFDLDSSFEDNSMDLDSSFEHNSVDAQDYLRILNLLLDSGCDVNSKDGHGNTPVLSIFPESYSLFQKITSLIPLEETIIKLKFLLKKGADIKLTNNDGDTALHRAIKISWFSKYSANEEWNLSIDETKHVEIVEIILNTNDTIDINAKNVSGKSPLELAICLASAHTVKVLLNYHAHLNSLTVYENDPYSFCYFKDLPTLKLIHNVINIVKMITDKGIELSLKNNLIIMKFLLHELKNCQCVNIDFAENSSYGWDKIINFGSPSHFQDIFCRVINQQTKKKIKKANLRAVKNILHAKKVAGFFIDKETIEFIESLNIKFTMDEDELAEIGTEISNMKSTKVLKNVTLYDLLLKNPNEIYQYVNNVNFFDLHLEDNFPIFINAIMGQVIKSLIRHYIEDCACNYVEKLIVESFPMVCSKLIMSYLSNEDILHLCTAAISLD